MSEPRAPRRWTRRRALGIGVAACASLTLGGAAVRAYRELARLHRLRSVRRRMGTEVAVTVHHTDPAEARRLAGAAFAEIERLEGILSRHREGTALDRLNREGRLDDAPPELTGLLTEARAYSELTGGAFDVTVAPLLRLYESAAAEGHVPDRAEIAAVLPLVDYRRVHVEGHTVRLVEPGMEVTLDAIGKGYIADRATAVLVGGGAVHAMVEAGGDVASVGGSGATGPWRVGIEDPRAPGAMLGVVELGGEGAATSGDYRAAFTPGPHGPPHPRSADRPLPRRGERGHRRGPDRERGRRPLDGGPPPRARRRARAPRRARRHRGDRRREGRHRVPQPGVRPLPRLRGPRPRPVPVRMRPAKRRAAAARAPGRGPPALRDDTPG